MEYSQRTLEITRYLPSHMQEAAAKYIEFGIEPSGFLTAVFQNDFRDAVVYADTVNSKALRTYAQLLYDVPLACKGSREAVQRWIELGGLAGVMKNTAKQDT